MEGDDEKENRPEFAASAREGTPGSGRARKGGGFSMRKSLAWNNAFFTEEGVLNNSEMSALSGSVSKSGGSFLSGIDEEKATPFTSKVFGKGKMELHPIEESSARRPLARTENKARNFSGMLSQLSPSTEREPLAHLTFGKLPVSKAPGKSILRPTRENSQKRLANTCTVNPASKIPRLKGTESSSLPAAPRRNIQPVKESKCMVLSDKLQPKSSSSSAKMHLTAAKPSFKPQTDAMVDKRSVPLSSSSRQTLRDGRYTHNLSLLPGSSPPISLPASSGQVGLSLPFSTQLTASSSHAGSKKRLPSSSQDYGSSTHFQVPCSSTQRLAKPSALRMPSPSLGFFLAGKVSSTNVPNSDRDGLLCLNSESKIQSIRKPNAERHLGGKITLRGSHEQPPSVVVFDADMNNDVKPGLGLKRVGKTLTYAKKISKHQTDNHNPPGPEVTCEDNDMHKYVLEITEAGVTKEAHNQDDTSREGNADILKSGMPGKSAEISCRNYNNEDLLNRKFAVCTSSEIANSVQSQDRNLDLGNTLVEGGGSCTSDITNHFALLQAESSSWPSSEKLMTAQHVSDLKPLHSSTESASNCVESDKMENVSLDVHDEFQSSSIKTMELHIQTGDVVSDAILCESISSAPLDIIHPIALDVTDSNKYINNDKKENAISYGPLCTMTIQCAEEADTFVVDNNQVLYCELHHHEMSEILTTNEKSLVSNGKENVFPTEDSRAILLREIGQTDSTLKDNHHILVGCGLQCDNACGILIPEEISAPMNDIKFKVFPVQDMCTIPFQSAEQPDISMLEGSQILESRLQCKKISDMNLTTKEKPTLSGINKEVSLVEDGRTVRTPQSSGHVDNVMNNGHAIDYGAKSEKGIFLTKEKFPSCDLMDNLSPLEDSAIFSCKHVEQADAILSNNMQIPDYGVQSVKMRDILTAKEQIPVSAVENSLTSIENRCTVTFLATEQPDTTIVDSTEPLDFELQCEKMKDLTMIKHLFSIEKEKTIFSIENRFDTICQTAEHMYTANIGDGQILDCESQNESVCDVLAINEQPLMCSCSVKENDLSSSTNADDRDCTMQGSTKGSSFEQNSSCDLKDNDTFLSTDSDDNKCTMHCSIKGSGNFTECKVGTGINSEHILKQGSVPLKNLLKAEPFTDEWIAAVEAFGEGILKVKSGSVQNSPPEKSLPEPNPWSPIKKKHHDLGPYDCTKYTKATSN